VVISEDIRERAGQHEKSRKVLWSGILNSGAKILVNLGFQGVITPVETAQYSRGAEECRLSLFPLLNVLQN
jgi:hypothetical protein